MGNLYYFPVEFWALQYGLAHFVETGTEFGEAVGIAARAPFRTLWTIEIDPLMAAGARRRFADDPRVRVLVGDSTTQLPVALAGMDGAPAMFWLDAHYPKIPGDWTTLPLPVELDVVSTYPGLAQSIVLVDDRHIYEDDWVEAGPFPEDSHVRDLETQPLKAMEARWAATHRALRSPVQEGYAAFVPLAWDVEAI